MLRVQRLLERRLHQDVGAGDDVVRRLFADLGRAAPLPDQRQRHAQGGERGTRLGAEIREGEHVQTEYPQTMQPSASSVVERLGLGSGYAGCVYSLQRIW